MQFRLVVRNSRVRAAALFAGIAGELHAINGKHVASDQALGITGHQDLAKQGFDLSAEVAHKLGDVSMAGLTVTTDGDELDVALATLFDDPAGDQVHDQPGSSVQRRSCRG